MACMHAHAAINIIDTIDVGSSGGYQAEIVNSNAMMKTAFSSNKKVGNFKWGTVMLI